MSGLAESAKSVTVRYTFAKPRSGSSIPATATVASIATFTTGTVTATNTVNT